MADQYIYEDSNEPQMTLEPFVQKKWVWVSDNNGGNYSGTQILIDNSSLSNSGLYIDWQSAFLTIPIVMRLSATSSNAKIPAIQTLQSAFAAGVKNGYYQFISSLSVEYQNTSIVQQTPFLNQYVNFKVLSTFSQETLAKYGPLLGLWPDTGAAAKYGAQSAADPNGHGSLNNRNLPQLPADLYSYASVQTLINNEGMYKRQVTSTALTPGDALAPLTAFLSASAAGSYGLNFFKLGTGGDVDSKYWFITAFIRLKDLSDVFDKMCLVKGSYVRLILNTNLVTHNFALTYAAGIPKGVLTDVSITQNVLSGGTSPVMLANASQPGNGFYQIADEMATVLAAGGVAEFTLTTSIARDTQTQVSHPTFTQCRLWCGLYQMNPVNEEAYLSLNKIKVIRYSDLYNYTVDVSCTGTPGSLQGSFSQLLTNGVPNVQYLVIIPFIAASANQTGNGTSNIPAYGSPFASEPGTSSPDVILTNFNIQVAGVNVFQQNIQYSWQDWYQEVATINAINGSQVDGLNSGLYTYEQWQRNPIYVADISRRLPAESLVPKAVQISGEILSGSITNIQLQCFLVFGKEMTIDLETGAKLG